MELKWPWLLGLGLLLAALVAVGVHRSVAERSRARTAAVANSTSLTELPAYQRALRRHRIRMALLAASATTLAAAALVGAARPLDSSVERPQTRNRDIMLCLDISGSMAAYDAELVRVFRSLVADFEGERIGLVIFNASAATVFPLTDDYDFINAELDTAEQALSSLDSSLDGFFAGTFNGMGTSLIGDGLATCVQGFDRIDTERARSIVFATDNQLAGRPLIDLDEAGELAKARGVRVYGLNPEPAGTGEEALEMREIVRGTAGEYYAMSDQGVIAGIVRSVQAQEASVIDSAARTLYTDAPAVPVGLAAVALGGLIAAGRRWSG